MGEITFNLRLGAEQLLVNTSPIPAPLLFEPPFPPEGAADLFEIALAVKLNADYLLLDKRDSRRIARTFGLNITGVLGIILKGWRDGEVLSIIELINQLRTQAHFHITPNLEQQILIETGEIDIGSD